MGAESGPTGFSGAEGPADPDLDKEYVGLLASLGYEPTPVDALVERTGLTAEVVSSMLLVLELRGYVSSASGGLYSRVPRKE